MNATGVSWSWRDRILVLGLLGLLFLAVLLSAQQDAGADEPPVLTSYSTAAEGVRALALWLEGLTYRVRRIEGFDFDPGRGDGLLFVLSPPVPFSAGEIKRVDDWVQEGGTLVLAGNSSLLAHYDLELDFLDETVEEAVPAQPLLLDPPWAQARVQTSRYLVAARDDVVVHLVAEGRPVLLSFEHGAGQVFAAATPFPFTNAGLLDPGNARLVHNLVAVAGAGGQIAFDEFHHGYQTTRTLTVWLQSTAQGRSVIYGTLVVFVYLLVGGRRFGRPRTLPQAAARRAPVEHVHAMANLFRRGGKQAAILKHYHDRLKRVLAQSRRLDPTLKDADFVAQLSALRLGMDLAALSKLLEETSREQVSEGELVRLAQEVDAWTGKIG